MKAWGLQKAVPTSPVPFTPLDLDRTQTRLAGISRAQEDKWRSGLTDFLYDAGTAIVFCHRYYCDVVMKPQSNNFRDVALICLFIACKAEEYPRKMRDCINISQQVDHPNAPPLPVDDRYWQRRDDLLLLEAHVLAGLGYELSVQHGFRFLVTYLDELKASKKVCQTAWDLLCESYRGNLPLLHPPHMMACACMYDAYRRQNEHPSSQQHRQWWTLFDADISVIDDIANELTKQIETRMLATETSKQPS